MTKPTYHNPPAKNDAPKQGQLLRVVRIVIAIALFAGIAVFSVITIEELMAGPPTNNLSSDFGASPTAYETQTDSTSPLAGLSGVNPKTFLPILRPNPHPGQFKPYLNAAPYGQPPYFQNLGGEIWEHSNYKTPNASLTELIAHYNKQAALRGMKLNKQHPTSNEKPGGIVAAWTDGQTSLNVTAWPLPNDKPVQPPLAPPTPLQWVVKYSYPATTPAP